MPAIESLRDPAVPVQAPRPAPPTFPPLTLVRWSGFAAMGGAVLILQAPLFHPEDSPEGFASPVWVANHFAFYVGYVLIQLALVGVLARQFYAAGRLGVIGFVVAFLGAGFTLMEGRDHIFSLPVLRLAGLQSSNPDELTGLWSLVLNAALFSVGHLILAAAMFRAGVLPRPAAALLGVGAPLLAFSPPIGIQVALIGSALYGSALLWIGYALITASGAPARTPARQAAGGALATN